MPFSEQYMISGETLASQTATLPATINIDCGFLPTKVWLTNETEYGVTTTGFETIQQIYWDSSNPTNTKLQYINAAGTALLPGVLTSNGISQYDGHAASPTEYLLGPKLAGTSYVKATGTFTISSTTSLYPGATVLMTSFSVDKQLGGMLFTVATVPSATTFTIANSGNWLNTASFTGGTQTYNVQLVTVPALYFPQNSQIVYISAANPAVVTTSTSMGLSVGQQVRLYVPKAFGMVQANFTTAVISAVSANQITLGGAALGPGGGFGVLNGLNSTAFTAFTWPLVTGVPYTPAYVIPIGSGPYPNSGGIYNEDTLQDATINTAFQGFTIGTSILQTAAAGTIGIVASDVFSLTAWRGDV
jgi:hypothetical protein